MRVLFLDFDGVIQLGDERRFQGSIERLNAIVRATAAVVVVSSSWRYGRTAQDLQQMLAARGFHGIVFCKTPEPFPAERRDGNNLHLAHPRGLEIREWLDAHPDVTGFAVLDDDADMPTVAHRHVKTQNEVGLKDEHVAQVIAHLLAPMPGRPIIMVEGMSEK